MPTSSCLIQQSAQRHPEATAVLAPHCTFTYARLAREVGGAEAYLTARFAPGARLALLAHTTPDTLVLLHASFRSKLTVCPLNPTWPPALQQKVAEDIQAEALLDPEALPLDPAGAPVFTPFAMDFPATIVLSSGSTGAPKRICHHYAHHVNSAEAANENLPLAPGDRWLLSLPLCHVSGIAVLFRCALAGAAVTLPAVDEALEVAIARTQATHVSLVSTQLQRLMRDEAGRALLRGLKGILLGGGPVPESLLRETHALGVPLVNSYGMTETASQVAATRPGAPLEELLSAGRPLGKNKIHLSEAGEILIKGPSLLAGYLEGGVLHTPLDEEGFFATGDLGAWTADGLLQVLGRRDNMFISGGENIYPEEIEHVLTALPGVSRAVVVPVPHAEFGQVPAAFVDLLPQSPFDPAGLRDAVARVLPRYKSPRHCFHWPAETTTENLKPSRALLAQTAARLLNAHETKADDAGVTAGVLDV